MIRILNSSFLTPLVSTISGGFSWKSSGGTLTLGLSSAKITYIRDRSIFERQKVSIYYGIPKGRDYLIEYGISLQLMTDTDLLKWLHWSCDFMFFKREDGAPWDLNMKNQFCLKISRYFMLNIRTGLFYEEKVATGLQIENMVSVGFLINFK